MKLEAERASLWGFAYRMTGSRADADDVVQETFARALGRPPQGELRPWLWRIASNVARDAYRRRRVRTYSGPWLPSPLEHDPDGEPAAPDPPDARYERLESVTFAFLVAMEALTPKQRAVLLLADVFDRDAREIAAMLESTETSVRVTLHRARKAMASYDARRSIPKEASARTQAALGRFLAALASGDEATLISLCHQDVRAISDGGGVYRAAQRPVLGASNVVRLYTSLARKHAPTSIEVRVVNGLPALVLTHDAKDGWAPRSVVSLEIDAEGRLASIFTVLAPNKLS